jgi:crotonobetainyl-CoA:carnitine CoA-transferase CaiB-like acyl-CoA transferase
MPLERHKREGYRCSVKANEQEPVTIRPGHAASSPCRGTWWRPRPVRRGDVVTSGATAPRYAAAMLEGITVLDLTQYFAGPSATRLLAELGADVIKVELAPGGDPSRVLPFGRDGRSGYYVQQNRGKRAICVDFARPESWELLARLAGQVDVVVENFGPGVLERRGLDYAALSSRHPRLVMASISAFGREGPWSHKVGYDQVAQAVSGLMALTGEPDGAPLFAGLPVADGSSGIHAFAGLGWAMYHRERTGRGQHVDIAMVDSLFCWHVFAVQANTLTGGTFRQERTGGHSMAAAPSGVFRGPVGWIVVLVLDRQWPGFCAAVGRPELVDDPRYGTAADRVARRDELNRLLEDWLAAFPTDEEAIAALDRHRIPAAPVLRPEQSFDHEYYRHRDLIVRVPDPVLGPVDVPGMPIRFGDRPAGDPIRAPLLGEHNEAVLGELLGLGSGEVARLVADGILHAATDR